MCILCVASRWSRRIVTLLPWLIFPLVLVWTLSQLLPPGLRFEITSPRLACVGVLLLSLAWYELLMPRLSDWRARRSLLLHEKRKIEALEAAKWRKEAVRKCRNCFMAYKDQKPQVGGKFMCTFCGHLSKRPALDVPTGIGHYIGGSRKELRMQGKRSWNQDAWPALWLGSASDKACVIAAHTSSLLLVFRLVSLVAYCLWWALSRLWRGGIIMSDADRSKTERKAGHRKGEDGNGQESKVERVKRKAEERRLARLEKEQMEAEERLQREEVARLVDERRRQRADAQKDVKVTDDDRGDDQIQRKKQDKAGVDKGRELCKSKAGAVILDDSRKARDKVKADRKSDDGSKAAVKPAEPSVIKPGSNAKAAPPTTGKPGAVVPVTKQQLLKVKASVLRKQDKSVSAAVSTGTISVSKVGAKEKVVSKPSAWNRISWAWGKGSKQHEKPSEVQLSTGTALQGEGGQVSPSLSPSPSPSPSPLPAAVEDVFPGSASKTPHAGESQSQSVYSTFMAGVPVSDAPASYDRWVANDLAPRSTWKMWEAPNLELPRLLVNEERIADKVSSQVLSSTFLSGAAGGGILPSVPISNNLWSNYHAFESARRIWEDDMQSDATPPEFVDCITQEVMKDPVIAADGHSYERSAIETWLKTHDTSPKTGEVLPFLGSSGGGVDKSLRPNHNLRGQIIEYRECMQRGLAPASGAGWQQSATDTTRKSHVGGIYAPPGLGSVWAYSNTSIS